MKRLIIIAGLPGVGKDTQMEHLFENSKYKINKAISFTTRPMRTGETEGVEYYFRDEETYLKEIEGKVLSPRVTDDKVTGKKLHYALTTDSLKEDCDFNITILDGPGVQRCYQALGAENVFVIYMTASDEVIYERCSGRGGMSEEDIKYRIEFDTKEFKENYVDQLSNVYIDTTNSRIEDQTKIIEEELDKYLEVLKSEQI